MRILEVRSVYCAHATFDLNLSPIYSDITPLNWTSSWVELRRCKWGFILHDEI